MRRLGGRYDLTSPGAEKPTRPIPTPNSSAVVAWIGRNPGVLGVVAAFLVGVGAIKAAYQLAEHSTGTGHFALFWFGYLAVLGTTVVAGFRLTTSDRARSLLLCGYGLVTFLPKTLMSTSGPVYFDEFGHLRQANDIIAHGSVDVSNSFLPIIKYFPGLEVVTVGLHRLTGLDTWTAGQVIVGAAHVGALFAMWRLAVALGVRSRYAFIAAVVFSLNPSYMYFDTEYAYESLGLPLAITAVAFLVFARSAVSRRRAVEWSGAAFLVGCAVVFTHHISAGFVSVMLILVALTLPVSRGRYSPREATIGPWAAAIGTALVFTVWVTTVARSTISYIQPHVQSALSEALDLVLRKKQTVKSSGGSVQVSSHQLFSGSGVPFYEIVCAYLAPFIALSFVAAAVVQVVWFRVGWSAFRRRLPFLLLGLGYLASLPIDVTATGGETAHRMWAYTYVGVAVCAVSAGRVWSWIAGRTRLKPVALKVVALAAVFVLAIGNVAAGEDVYYRFPGPYVFGTDTRSRTPELYALAKWANAHIPPGTRVVTDRDTGEVIEAYTRLVVPAPGQSDAYYLYLFGNDAPPALVRYLNQQDFQYWILDLRIGRDKPQEKLFETYYGPESVNPQAVADAGNSRFLESVYRSANYEVLRIG